MIDEAVERLQAEDPEKARVVVLKFFGGRTNRDVAEIMGVTERTVERHWAFAKAWLFQSICGELTREAGKPAAAVGFGGPNHA